MSRKAYGALEELAPINVTGETNRHRFRIESGSGNDDSEQVLDSQLAAYLENPEYETRWYFKYFLGRGNSALYTTFLGNYERSA
jgi:hypothetical protein